MKKSAVLICGVFLLLNTAFAGGILTNTNQSAQFVRMLSRNASIDLDAVYFNPAGLSQLQNGFYFGLSSQTIFQTRTINSEFPTLHNSAYKGETTVPVYPDAYAVYKLDKWAFSAGFGPNAGGGTAKYNTGLPSFEKLVSSIPASLKAQGIPTTDYSTAIKLEGSSIFWGTQLNVTYAINDIVSVSAGVRVVMANNTYSGYVKDIKINPTYPAFGFDGTMRSASTVFGTLAFASSTAANKLQPLISGAGGLTLAQVQGAGYLSAADVAQLKGGLGASYNASMTVSQIQSAYNEKALYLSGKSTDTADKIVDTKQTGTGFAPIIGVDIHLDKLNIGLKYEHQTTLTITNSPSKNDNYSDKIWQKEFGNDIPAIISGGADYKITDALKVSASFTEYMDNWVGWGDNVYGQHRSIDKNYLELAFGAEYQLTKNFALSAGYLNSNTGVSQAYQSDFSYSNDSYTTGLGFQWNINKKLVFDAGLMLTTYTDYTKTFDKNGNYNADNAALINSFGSYTETYGKDTFTFAFGISYKIL